MKCGIEIIVGVILRKPVVKVEIEAFWIAILTLTAGDGLIYLSKVYIYIYFVVYVSFVFEIIILIVGFPLAFYFCAFKLLDRQQVKKCKLCHSNNN
jgi:hypothetical protein